MLKQLAESSPLSTITSSKLKLLAPWHAVRGTPDLGLLGWPLRSCLQLCHYLWQAQLLCTHSYYFSASLAFVKLSAKHPRQLCSYAGDQLR